MSKLEAVLDMYQPKTISQKEMVEDGKYPVFGANGQIGWHNDFNHEKPEVLLTCRGATCGFLNWSLPNSWINGNAMVMRPKDPSKLSREFLFKALAGGVDTTKSITGAAQPQITRKSLNPLCIPIPPLEEQERIVAILDEAFAAIDKAKANIERNLTNARELFQSKLNELTSQSGDMWRNETIQGLIKGSIIERPIDGNHGEIHPKKADFKADGIPFIMASHLQDGEVNQQTCHFISKEQADGLRKGFAKSGDVLLSHKGTIGRTAILHTDFEYVVLTPQVTYYRIKDLKQLFNRYLYHFFNSQYFQDQIREVAGLGSTRAYIGITKQHGLKVNYPINLEDQMGIASVLDELSTSVNKLVSRYSAELSSLEELRQSILEQAFEGKLTEPVAA